MADIKEISIGNTTYDVKAKTVVDTNSGSVSMWTGTKAQYEAIATKDSNTLYNITDDTDVTLTLLQTIYPVGSIYITTNSTCPLASLFGTWTLVGADRVLQGAGTRGAVGTTVEESLPNITGEITVSVVSLYNGQTSSTGSGVFSSTGSTSTASRITYGSGGSYFNPKFDASDSSSTYQTDAPVQQDAYLVNIYRRTA